MSKQAIQARIDALNTKRHELGIPLARLAEKDTLTAGEVERMNNEMRAVEKIDVELRDLQGQLVNEAAQRANLEGRLSRGFSDTNSEHSDGARRDPIPGVTDRGNIYDLNGVRNAAMLGAGGKQIMGELRSRARQAIEEAPDYLSDDQREAATNLVETHCRAGAGGKQSAKGSAIAAHILSTGSPEYHEAFFDLLDGNHARAAMTLTNANGGFLVPFTLDPTIILTNNGATNPFREIATIKTTVTSNWHGVTSAGVTAGWLAEATEASDNSPTFAQPSITPQKAAAWLQASFEVTEDSDIATDIGMLIQDAKDRLEATAFAVGSGSGQPNGCMTAVSAVTASRVAGSSGGAGGATYVLGDVYALANALPPRYRKNSSWLAEQTTLNATRRFGEGSAGNAAFWADLGVGIPPTLLGRPVYESSEMDNTIVSGSNDDVLLIGDFSKYFIVDRIGLSIAYEPLVKGTSRRPTGEVGWFAYWRVGGDCTDTNAFRLLRL